MAKEETKKEKTLFETLRDINVTGHVEKKNGLNYLSWAWAIDEVMKRYPNVVYEIERFEDKPYLYDEKTGYMVFTRVRIDDTEREMWLPVMDSNNKAMLDHDYTYKVAKYEWKDKVKTKVGEEVKTVEAATMFDINKTIMRCLVKNLAMFGLGLALYSGEDLPEEELTEEQLKARAEKIKEEALTYTFPATSKKVPNMTILEALEKNPKYLQWYLDSDKYTEQRVKEMIMAITDMKPTEIPTDEEQMEIFEYLNKFNTMSDEQRETIYKKYNVKSNKELTLKQLREIFV